MLRPVIITGACPLNLLTGDGADQVCELARDPLHVRLIFLAIHAGHLV